MSLDTDPAAPGTGDAGGAASPAARGPEATAAAATSAAAGRLAWACVALAVLPIVVAAVRAVSQHWVPVGDNAYFGLRARDVLTDNHPLLGTWTSASLTLGLDVNNPGPLLFDALAIPAKLGGDAGVAVGVALINVAAVLGMAVAARRQAGARGVVVAMAAAVGLAWSMGSELLVDPWQPHSLLLPVLCYLILVWGLTCGDLGLLPWAVGLASFVVQTHVGYAVIVPALGAWGVAVVAVRLWRVRRHDGEAWTARLRQVRRAVVLSAVVAALCWAQPVYEQLLSDGRGNLGRLASSLTKSEQKIGLPDGPRYVAKVLALPPWWGRPSARDAFKTHTVLPSLPVSMAGLALVAAVLVAAAVVARRRHDGPGTAAAATGLVVVGVAVVAAVMMPVGILGVVAHHLRWLWPLAVFVSFSAVLPLAIPPGRGRGFRFGTGAVAVATLGVSVLTLPAWNAQVGPSLDADAMPAIRALRPQLDSLRGERAVLVDVAGIRFAEPYTVPVMDELDRLGVPWYVDYPGMPRQVGEGRRYTGGASLRLYFREGDAAREVPPGARRVAFVDGLTPDEADELDGLKEQLTPFIEDGGLVLNDHARAVERISQERDTAVDPDRIDAEIESAAELRDPEHVFAPGTASSRYLRRLVYLVVEDNLDVSEPWAARLERYAELQQQADRLTIAVIAEPLEDT